MTTMSSESTRPDIGAVVAYRMPDTDQVRDAITIGYPTTGEQDHGDTAVHLAVLDGTRLDLIAQFVTHDPGRPGTWTWKKATG